jgi:hypothetical protein
MDYKNVSSDFTQHRKEGIVGDRGFAQINIRQPSEPTYIGRSRLPVDVDVNYVEFRYMINDALIPGNNCVLNI